jgi:hypothetical protein
MTLDNTAQSIELQIFLKDFDFWESIAATGYLVGSYPIVARQFTDGLLQVSVPANATAANRTDNVLIKYYKGGTPTTISIQINQYA